jgi:hypothetical protein
MARVDLEGHRPRAALVIRHARKCFRPESSCREGSSLIFQVPQRIVKKLRDDPS